MLRDSEDGAVREVAELLDGAQDICLCGARVEPLLFEECSDSRVRLLGPWRACRRSAVVYPRVCPILARTQMSVPGTCRDREHRQRTLLPPPPAAHFAQWRVAQGSATLQQGIYRVHAP